MHIDLLWHWLLALPALVLPGLIFDAPKQPSHTVRTTVAATPKATATPTPAVTPTATPAARTPRTVTATPKPTAVATPKAAPAATPVPGGSDIATEAQCAGQGDVSKSTTVLVCMTSVARVAHGLPGITANGALMAAAVAKNQDQLSCGYGHEACGHPFNYWMTNKGYTGRCTAENIAMGQRTPREVFVAWMNSSGHRANILNRSYKDIGVAELASSKGPLWTMELGGC